MTYKKDLLSIYPIYNGEQIFKYIFNSDDEEVYNILKEQKTFINKNGKTKYDEAYEEISNGRKKTCWIWYIWPNVPSLRNAKSSKPQFDLKNFYSCLTYLNNDELLLNLVKIIFVVNCQLDIKYKKSKNIEALRNELFGSSIDVLKYYDCITLFSVASKILSSIDHKYNVVFDSFCFSITKYHMTDNDHLAILKQDTIQAIREETNCFYNVNSVNDLKNLKLKVIY